MNDQPETPEGNDSLRLTDIEQRYLDQDGYDSEGHLSHSAPGDTLRELIHEIRQTRTAIRLAQATFVSKTELEKRLEAAGHDITHLRKQSSRRLWIAVGVIVVALIAMGAGGIVAASAYRYQQRQAAYDRCLQGNAFRQGDHELWNKVIALSNNPNPTPQEQKTVTDFEAFLDKHDQLLVCKKP